MNTRSIDAHDKVTTPLPIPILCVGEMLTEPMHFLEQKLNPTVKVERFAGLNFCIFADTSFVMPLFKHKAPQNFSLEKFIWWNS